MALRIVIVLWSSILYDTWKIVVQFYYWKLYLIYNIAVDIYLGYGLDILYNEFWYKNILSSDRNKLLCIYVRIHCKRSLMFTYNLYIEYLLNTYLHIIFKIIKTQYVTISKIIDVKYTWFIKRVKAFSWLLISRIVHRIFHIGASQIFQIKLR